MPRPATSIDSETLQADVMRFMAIIAFCLIAILALVRNIEESPQPVAAVQEPVAEPVPPTPAPPATPTQPAAEPVSATVARTVVMEETPIPPVETARLPPPTPAPDDEAEPLSLSFASEAVFLSLIREGDVRLLAQRDDGYVHLGADLRVRPGALPGNLYELYPASVPDSLLTIMAAGRSDSLFAALSVPIEEALGRYLRNPDVISQGGNLTIQANGEIDYDND